MSTPNKLACSPSSREAITSGGGQAIPVTITYLRMTAHTSSGAGPQAVGSGPQDPPGSRLADAPAAPAGPLLPLSRLHPEPVGSRPPHQTLGGRRADRQGESHAVVRPPSPACPRRWVDDP